MKVYRVCFCFDNGVDRMTLGKTIISPKELTTKEIQDLIKKEMYTSNDDMVYNFFITPIEIKSPYIV